MKQKAFTKTICIILAIAFVASAVFVVASSFSFNAAVISDNKTNSISAKPSSGSHGYVNGDYVNFRSGAGTNYSVITTMRKNTKFIFVDGKLYNNDWYKIKLDSNLQTGYINKDYASVSDTSSTTDTTYVKLNKSSLNLGVGENYTLTKSVSPSNSKTDFKWSSSNTKAATVNSNGYISAKKTGTSNITVKISNGKTATCKVTVKSAPKSVKVSSSSLKLGKGETFIISESTNSGSYANSFSWSSSNKSVATVEKTTSNKAKITAKAEGTAKITIKTYNGKTAVCNVTVKSAPKSVKVSNSSLTLDVNKTFVISESTNSGSYANSFSWSSSNTSVATVEKTTSNKAKITAIGEGTATITIKTYNGKTATCKVTVKSPPSSIKLSDTSETLYKGNYYTVTATASGAVKWSSSNTSVATVSNGVIYAKSNGTAEIKATCGSSSASCEITVKTGSDVDISNTKVSIRKTKSILLTSSTGGVKWNSSNTSIATVNNGIVYAKNSGTAVITAYTSSGAATCLLTVGTRDNIRFTYASPNSAPLNSTVNFKAITDTDRVAVRFVVTNGSQSYTVNADKKEKDGNTYVWTGTQKLSKSGKWTVKAYAKYKTSNEFLTTPGNGEGEVFVTSSTDKTTPVCAERRASDEVINLIANYEGFLSSVTADSITSDPTLGYGKVVTSGEQFYNNLTKNEAYAYLCQTVNKGGYTTRTNKYLLDNDIKFNQRQFDSLVCFTYNVGAGVIYNDSELQAVLLNTGNNSSIKKGAAGYVNASDVNLRKGSGTNYDVITCMPKNTKFTFVDGKVYNSDWYKIKLSNGTTGYIFKSYASVSSGSSGSRNLNNVDKQQYLNAFLQYHHAAGSCYWGLMYRRIDEAEVFFYGDYERNGEYNNHNFKFTCQSYSNFSIA